MRFDTRDEQQQRLFTRRALLLSGGGAALFGLLAGRLYYLQVVEAPNYAVLAEENRINIQLLAPLRGVIYDRFGRELANNRQNYRAVLVPEYVEDLDRTLDLFSRIVPLDEAARARIHDLVKRQRGYLPVTLAENLSWQQFAEINIHGPNLPGVQPDVGEIRVYPEGVVASHVVGYVAPVSEEDNTGEPVLMLPGFKIGKAGVEKNFEQNLRGRAGSKRVEVNAYGRVIRELGEEPSSRGGVVTLSLDTVLQRYVTDRLHKEVASVTVMDIHEGDILALASSPGYDPNLFVSGMDHNQWQALLDDPGKPLNNKAVSGLYPPASTFKMIVALCGLHYGLIRPGDRVFCKGKYRLGNRDFYDWKRSGHGSIDLVRGIEQSCDVYFYELARKIGIDRIADMARRFGLGTAFELGLTGIRSGLVPDKSWKRAHYGEAWLVGETLNAGIGQGYMLATPLQLAVMTARIANGGRAVEPRLVRALDGDVLPVKAVRNMAIDPKHIELMRRAMWGVCNNENGTAYHARISGRPYQMAGKTGTAQVRNISAAERRQGILRNEERKWKDRDHALFVGFAPYDTPRYAIAVVVEHGGSGSRSAAPIARDVLIRTVDRDPLGREPRYAGR